MRFNKHSNLEGQHAFLGASKHAWTNYDELKLDTVYRTHKAAILGTELHDLAQRLIRMGVKLPRTTKTLNMYVNDAIGFRMTPEQPLFYSFNCFGTPDAIAFRGKKLRIHDLKTGVIPGSMRQPNVYAALFCLEYDIRPADIEIELRIYQNDEILVEIGDTDFITHLMDKIIRYDKLIESIKAEEED